MCGIFGFVGFRDDSLLTRMGEVLVHRGPDDSGCYVTDEVSLGNRRLAIIDLPGGHQPISDEGKERWVTYNGEIYNFRELRASLSGHRFATNADTEVIVHAHEAWGDEAVKRLNGMFAYALWSEREKRLLLARDRVGIKPLYYALLPQGIIFASEVKSIIQCEAVRREVDPEAFQLLLNLMYIPGERTMFRGIRKLLPGHTLTWQAGQASVRAYWEPRFAGGGGFDETAGEAQLLRLLSEAVERCMISDVPLGSFLSGGMDTSTIVAFMTEHADGPVKTFCMGFGEEGDELEDAYAVAEHFGTDHREIVISPNYVKEYPRALWHADAPMFNLYPYFLSEFVRPHVKVIMSGLGGDELFGGYVSRYRTAKGRAAMEAAMPGPLLSVASQAAGLVQYFDRILYFDKLKRYARSLANAPDKAHYYLMISGALSGRSKARCLGPSLDGGQRVLLDEFRPFFSDGREFTTELLHADFSRQLPDYYLAIDDSMTMAHSVEPRVPLLDAELVEFALGIPWQYKVADGGKYMLRKAMTSRLPKRVLRKKKAGFSVNVYNWYKNQVAELAKQMLPDGAAVREGYCKRSFVRLILSAKPTPKLTREYATIWTLVLYEMWHKIYVESADVCRPTLELNKLS